MNFNWQTFLDQRGIDYAERGPSTSRGNLYIHCPFCGDADAGRHMGVHIEKGFWGCWRNQQHRGKNPQRLIQALLGCSWAEAGRLMGKRLGGSLWGADDGLGQMLAGFERTEEAPRQITLPSDFRPLLPFRESAFVDYLVERGYTRKDLQRLTDKFNLQVAYTGDFAYRVIFPVYNLDKELVTWTGRAIGDKLPRYKTLTATKPEKDKQYARGPITDYILGLNKSGFEKQPCTKHLVICEGPFDALNLAIEGWWWNDDVTCLFGKTVSDAQLDILAQLRERYRAMFLVLDPEASTDALQLQARMKQVGVDIHSLKGTKDPGELNKEQKSALFRDLAERSAINARSFAKASGRT